MSHNLKKTGPVTGLNTNYGYHFYQAARGNAPLWYGSVQVTYPIGPAAITQPLPQLRPIIVPPVELQEAEIIWGGPSNFGFLPAPTQTWGMRVIPPEDKDEPEKEKKTPRITLTEMPEYRKTEIYSVPAPDDPELTLSVERMLEGVFLGPDRYGKGAIEVEHQLIFKPPAK